MKLENNLFGNTLKELITSNKNVLSRKILANILGVTESAISQWVCGKIFPEPDKIRSIIIIYNKISSDELARKNYAKFIKILEFPLLALWQKAPENLQNIYTSDYILIDMQTNLQNSMSFLYFELKEEIYYQFQKQLEQVKEGITNCVFNEKYFESNSKLSKLSLLNKMKLAMLDNKLDYKLNIYTNKIKEIHTSINLLLKEKLETLIAELDCKNEVTCRNKITSDYCDAITFYNHNIEEESKNSFNNLEIENNSETSNLDNKHFLLNKSSKQVENLIEHQIKTSRIYNTFTINNQKSNPINSIKKKLNKKEVRIPIQNNNLNFSKIKFPDKNNICLENIFNPKNKHSGFLSQIPNRNEERQNLDSIHFFQLDKNKSKFSKNDGVCKNRKMPK